ncbi:LutC/YkgG family protein [Ferruginibacter sp.]
MSSREKILAAVKNNQPALQQLPVLEDLTPVQYQDKFEQFTNVLKTIGGNVVVMNSMDGIAYYVKNNFGSTHIVTTINELPGIQQLDNTLDPHFLENIELAVIKVLLGVAENGAVWVTDAAIKIRALPFICQHLAVVLNKKDIVHNMHEAYENIGNNGYDFGVFIAGPSKTADIEQSLVLGAHGPKTMTVFVIE